MRHLTRKVLPFVDPASRGDQSVGKVHPDGSITFRGRTYATLRDVPPECLGLRSDTETYKQWRALYRAVHPKRRDS